MSIKINALRDVINMHSGQFMSVSFIKEDGTPRTLTGKVAIPTRALARKVVDTKGGDAICTIDDPRCGFRTVRLDRIVTLRLAGMVVEVTS